MKERRIHREREPIGVRRKEFWEVKMTDYLLSDKFKLCHEPDGLIYQPVDTVGFFISHLYLLLSNVMLFNCSIELFSLIHQGHVQVC